MPAATPYSQTLDRGIQVLEILAEAEHPLTTAEIAAALGVHRSIVYRILRTLEDHRLVSRENGAYAPGVGLATLARGVSKDLHTAALPELAAVANELGMTCFVVVPDGDECITLLSVEPRQSVAVVAQRPGTRHSINAGAPGLALLAGMPAKPGERPEVGEARLRGYASTRGEVLPGMASVAVPIVSGTRGTVAAIAVVHTTGVETDEPAIAARLQRAARAVAAELP
ncbi:MAG: IclR family transcriptional regulator [Actinomadura rubrobrunea]|nr:IclR family transcriptional regulator [Actinomadura rubrobrunea]